MSHQAAKEEIMRAFQTAFQMGLPVEYENLPFTQPKASPWGRLTLSCGRTTPAACGGPKLNRTPFVLYLQVFIPEDQGTKAAYQAGDALSALDYYNVRVPGVVVHFDTAGVEPGTLPSTTPESGFAAFNVTIGGHYDTSAAA